MQSAHRLSRPFGPRRGTDKSRLHLTRPPIPSRLSTDLSSIRGPERKRGRRRGIIALLSCCCILVLCLIQYEILRLDNLAVEHGSFFGNGMTGLSVKAIKSTGLTDVVQWDRNSMIIRHRPVFIISGEFHYWRLPVQHLYLDIFQKMRATGHNAVSIYFHWGYHAVSEDNLIFQGVGRDIQAMLDAAKRAGLYVIARPGPYIHAETSAGGIPGWLVTKKGVEVRTDESTYTKAWQKYWSEIIPIIARNQIDRGGNVIALQIENEYMESDFFPSARKYMRGLSDGARKLGIVVPIFHNDLNMFESFTPKNFSAVDLYGLDSYPRGFDCGDPMSNFNVLTNYRQYLARVAAETPNFAPEFQGGAYDLWGGTGYDSCMEMTGPEYVNVFYKNNVAQKFTMMSHYMAYGGTNWGGLASPSIYTSYDYGAAISESRIVRDKANEAKLLWTFLRSSPTLLNADFVADSDTYAYTDNNDVFATELRDPHSLTGYYVVRSRNTNSRDGKAYRLNVRTIADGQIQIPCKGSLTLRSRESQIIVTDYEAGPLRFGYSTMEVFTWTTVDEKPVLIMYGNFEDLNEFSIKQHGDVPFKFYNIRGNAVLLNYSVKSASTETNDLRITSMLDGESRAVVESHDYILVLMNRPDIYNVWAPGWAADLDPNTPPHRQVIVIGPYLVRNVTSEDNGKTLNIYGDIDMESNSGDIVEVYVDSSFENIKWNGEPVHTYPTKFKSRTFRVPKPNNNLAEITIPDLRRAEWRAIDAIPDIHEKYDDSEWTVADKLESTNKWYPPETFPVLYPGEYGFHVGNVIYRGRFSGCNAKGVKMQIWGGAACGFTAWLNGEYLTSYRGSPHQNWIEEEVLFPDALASNEKTNVLVILADRMGYELDNGVTERDPHSTLYPRGIRLVSLIPDDSDAKCDFSKWTIQGNAGGEDYDDLLRAPYNEDGIYAQRIGAHLPAFDDKSWQSATPYVNFLAGKRSLSPKPGAGVWFYRTVVDIVVPDILDVPIGVRMRAGEHSGVRVELFINGWQFGKYISDIGPQEEFPIPPGIINTNGENVVGVQIWAVDNNATAGLDVLEFFVYGKYASSIGGVPHDDYKGWSVERELYVS
ncbi:glycoside hydrolase superfamily [Lipomyces tetrasporus]|uniref:beta-galactosidase n=1 Tax=Lipomyces tetrasporus TaxID=54092 RepID=A0AAD7QUW1_9ASCO|nr:glycoside hydrolase superfamily [Lipomyces tetrasporus]KAJ8101436.1 glycoside hydrolase superfamily [Lipomyces tetrasporus]